MLEYHRSEEFLKFVATTKVKIHNFPPYSPYLNPIERLWKIMHENTTYHRYPEGIMGFLKI